MTTIPVNVRNFARAETDRMFRDIAAAAGGVGVWHLFREPTPLDQQTVVRMNRDTLYSAIIVDLAAGAELTLPDAGNRYMSAMVINQDHYINRIHHDAGTHSLTMDEFDTRYVIVGVRILVDPADPEDVAAVNALQDQLGLTAGSNEPYPMPDYDTASFDATRDGLLALASGLPDYSRSFGRRDEVDPVEHLIATASAFGGLPATEATYLNVDPGLPVGEYAITVGDVPVDAFWSVTVYDAKGYLDATATHLTSVNSITATKDGNGTITVNFGASDQDKPNYLSIGEGWNYLVRLYRPRPEVLDGKWSFPALEPIQGQ
jgi:hypothetical protein